MVGDVETSVGDVERAALAEVEIFERGGAAVVHPVAGQIDAVASDGAGQVVGVPVQAVVPADTVAKRVRHEADGFRGDAILDREAEACLEVGHDQIRIDDIVELAVRLRPQVVREIADIGVRIAQKLLGEGLDCGRVERALVQPVGVDAGLAVVNRAQPVMDDRVVVERVVDVLHPDLAVDLVGLFIGIVWISQMGDDVIDQGGLHALVATNSACKCAVSTPVGRVVACGRDHVIGGQREVSDRAAPFVIAAHESQADIVVDEHVVFDEAATTDLRPEGSAAHDDVVTHSYVCVVPINIEVVIEHLRRLAAVGGQAWVVIGCEAVMVEQVAFDQEAIGITDESACHKRVVYPGVRPVRWRQIISIDDRAVADGDVFRLARKRLDHQRGFVVIADLNTIEDHVVGIEDGKAIVEIQVADHDILTGFTDGHGPEGDRGLLAIAIRGDVDRMQGVFAMNTVHVEIGVVVIAVLKQQPVRGRLCAGPGDRAPKAHAQIDVQRGRLGGAVLRIVGEPVAGDLVGVQAFHCGDVLRAERTLVTGDVDHAMHVTGL
ncbi:hypothetical protein thalar_03674 [Litoreibacter arenae DSM 19593]|uniref:Uncharacterized protein n=1 Tax=Litoreibacter arenae DSM 19593 TaxID=1123360 RepID=S9REE6_9RHOB|nr:hypothetical protein thalar_03674 [Litoreibacter arenae DSM 19593]